MRYHKGSLGLNQMKDKAILHFVADSRYVTRSQLSSFVLFEYCEPNRRVFNWRIQRLVEAGLMRKQVVPYLNGEALYSITRAGVQALERLGIYYLGANLEREKDALEFQIPHSLEVNNIRIALKATTNLMLWIPETAIRVLNLSPATAYAKVYDGIAELYVDGDYVTLAIEYERTFKSKSKYDKIWEAIESEKRLNVFLYLVPTLDLQWASFASSKARSGWCSSGWSMSLSRKCSKLRSGQPGTTGWSSTTCYWGLQSWRNGRVPRTTGSHCAAKSPLRFSRNCQQKGP